ncbi:hypothetical protein M422DRAFT_252746 [Sphaerobolus stellatus SS14]|uniref:Uncharacterized protein n=1 Tax=Sphaerobolus stellatus (strain SS14) TaxID=990650 RepID=A0A0C9VXY5_SPHS4|nr:hypothetical protein M422DRAFT_252746 [Sphaerobolus stellatus SS14]
MPSNNYTFQLSTVVVKMDVSLAPSRRNFCNIYDGIVLSVYLEAVFGGMLIFESAQVWSTPAALFIPNTKGSNPATELVTAREYIFMMTDSPPELLIDSGSFIEGRDKLRDYGSEQSRESSRFSSHFHLTKLINTLEYVEIILLGAQQRYFWDAAHQMNAK